MSDFTGRTAIVTGAASGIGRGIAEALGEAGAQVLLVDRSPAVTEVAQLAGASALEADIAAPEVPDRLLDWLAGRPLDHLVAAAGIQVRTPAIDIAEEDWTRLLDVNLSSFYRTVRRLIPALRSSDPLGSVLAISSMSADRVLPGIVPYGAVKAGLSQLIKGLAVELGAQGPRINAIAPGYILTGMTAESLSDPERRARIVARTPMERLGEPSDVTGPALFLLSDAARFVTGHTLPVDGGYALS